MMGLINSLRKVLRTWIAPDLPQTVAPREAGDTRGQDDGVQVFVTRLNLLESILI